jgi:hypothetical protein
MTGFDHPYSFSFNKLMQYVVTDEWQSREAEVGEDEVEQFATR